MSVQAGETLASHYCKWLAFSKPFSSSARIWRRNRAAGYWLRHLDIGDLKSPNLMELSEFKNTQGRINIFHNLIA